MYIAIFEVILKEILRNTALLPRMNYWSSGTNIGNVFAQITLK